MNRMGNRIGYNTQKDLPQQAMPESGSSLRVEDISPEIMFCIFMHVPVKDLLKSTICVCKYWHQLLSDCHFWFLRLKAEGLRLSETSKAKLLKEPDGAKVLRILQGYCGRYLPFNTNLILNPSGKDKFKHWTVYNRGDKMIVECPPVGTKELPEDAGQPTQHCFVTSYGECIRSQGISLRCLGIDNWMMEILKPQIHISEWVAARFDCHSQSRIIVVMKGSKDTKEVKLFWSSDKDDVMLEKWYKVETVVLDYPTGLWQIKFTNIGKDRQFWAGHYGAKTAGSTVELVI